MDYTNPQTTITPASYANLNDALNYICSYLNAGYTWHKRIANQCRKIHIRGWGRWHDCEADGDSDHLICLEKLLMDKLKYAPTIDMKRAEMASTAKLDNLNDFKDHHRTWKKHEQEGIAALNYAVNASRSVDIEVYYKMCALLDEAQKEVMRLEMAYDRLEFGGWMGHDIGVCSMIVHKYFELEHKDGHDINFNLG